MATVLFECAIVLNEKRDTAGNITEPAVMVREPFYILASNQTQANLLAGKEVPESIVTDAEKFDRAVIIVRPF